MARFEKIGLLAAFAALAFGGCFLTGTAAASPSWPSYEGTDPGRVPVEARPFVYVPAGLRLDKIKVHGDSIEYYMRAAVPVATPFDYGNGPTADEIWVQVFFRDTAADVDAVFQEERSHAEGECNAIQPNDKTMRCQHVEMGMGNYGSAIIANAAGKDLRQPHVQDYYLVRLPGNTLAYVWANINSNWTNTETFTKTVASGLAKIGVAAPVTAQSVVAKRVTDTAAAAWSKMPTRDQAEKNLKTENSALLSRDDKGLFVCKLNAGRGKTLSHGTGTPPPQLMDDKLLMGAALATLNVAKEDVSALIDGFAAPEVDIPATIRERAYMLAEPGRIQDYLYGAQLNYAPEAGDRPQKTVWHPGMSLLQYISSECGSVRGTINGGGDFIQYRAPAAQAGLIPIAAAPQTMTVELPGTIVTMPISTLAAFDLAPNGVAAVAVLSGSAQIVEKSSGARRTVGAGQIVLSAPGLGLTQSIPVNPAANQNLNDAQRGPASASPAPLPAAPSAVAASISDIQTARQVAFGQPVGASDVFPPDNNPIFVWFHHRGIAPGGHITAVWYFLETAQPLEIGRGDVVVQPPSDWGQFSFSLAEGKAWPQGRYRVDLSVNGQPMGSANFRIATAPAQAPITKSQTYTNAAAGYSVQMPSDWVQDESSTELLRLVNGALSIGMEVQLVHNPDPISGQALFAEIEKQFRTDPDFTIDEAYDRSFPALNRAGHAMRLHARNRDEIRQVAMFSRGRGNADRDFYLIKVVGATSRKDAINRAMEQIVSGFEIH